MTSAALGMKRRCLSCGAPFLDLQRDPIVCPRCKAVFTPPPPLPRRSPMRAKIPEPVQPIVSEAVAVEDEEPAEKEEEPDDDLLPLES